MGGFLNDLNQPLTAASAVALEEIGRIYFQNGAWYKYGAVDATVAAVPRPLFYKKTGQTATAHAIYAVHDHATAAHFRGCRVGGWPCFAGTSTLKYGWFFYKGTLDTNVLASVLTDTTIADQDFVIPGVAVDGELDVYTLGTNDAYVVGMAHAADSSTALSNFTAMCQE